MLKCLLAAFTPEGRHLLVGSAATSTCSHIAEVSVTRLLRVMTVVVLGALLLRCLLLASTFSGRQRDRLTCLVIVRGRSAGLEHGVLHVPLHLLPS